MGIQLTEDQIFTCCSSKAFASKLVQHSPFYYADQVVELSRLIWWNQTPISEWLEAFAAHPKIGDIEGLRKKYGAFAEMSSAEQAGANTASRQTLEELAHWNTRYEEKFGHIFVICASGKSAEEMLKAIQSRYPNDPATELTNAAIEQQKITELRLQKVLLDVLPPVTRRTGQLLSHFVGRTDSQQTATTSSPAAGSKSPITSHVLDTCLGKPAQGVHLTLQRQAPGSNSAWQTVGTSATNNDGRSLDLLPPTGELLPGVYRILFDTEEYMARCRAAHPGFFAERPFYPAVAVTFEITPEQTRQHFHVPLTWNPYGYSTYRGS